MTKWHKFFYYLQFSVLFAFVVLIFIENIRGSLAMGLLMFGIYFTEIGILEQDRRMNKALIFYRKSGFFAMLDLFAVTIFLGYTAFFAADILFLENVEYYSIPFISILIYTLVRKLYIFKNYTYEK
jgi:hypothetical protein